MTDFGHARPHVRPAIDANEACAAVACEAVGASRASVLHAAARGPDPRCRQRCCNSISFSCFNDLMVFQPDGDAAGSSVRKTSNCLRRTRHVRGAMIARVDQLGRGPKIAVPTRTMVAPSSMAVSKSLLMPMDSSVRGMLEEACFASRSRRSRNAEK